MINFWWLIHILGISIWFGSLTAVLFIWPSKGKLLSGDPTYATLKVLVRLFNRSTHTGAGLAALAGIVLSFQIQPKSELGTLWLTYMQGAGVIAFVLSVFVLTRMGKRLMKLLHVESPNDAVVMLSTKFRITLFILFALLFSSFIMAAFKPTI